MLHYYIIMIGYDLIKYTQIITLYGQIKLKAVAFYHLAQKMSIHSLTLLIDVKSNITKLSVVKLGDIHTIFHNAQRMENAVNENFRF